MTTLLAKPDVTLLQHSLEVLHLGMTIGKKLGLADRLYIKALLACALHDIGKGNENFQQYIRGVGPKKAFPHALVSFPFILYTEQMVNAAYGWNTTDDLLASAAVLSHHSPLQTGLYKDYEIAPPLSPSLMTVLKALWQHLQQAGICNLPPAERILQQATTLLHTLELKNLLDFSGYGVSLRQKLKTLPPKEFAAVKATLHLADWLASAGIHTPATLFLENGNQSITHFVHSFTLRQFQQRAHRSTSSVLWLRAPTGTGKTEALLLWAGDTQRILYLLPTQATANAMYQRLQKIYGNEAVSLVHGRASYYLRSAATEEPPLEKQLFGSVFATPITVATLDQYLLGHLNGRHWEERRILAQSATILLDEIHTYEPYTLGLLAAALEQDPPAKIAFASATLPSSLMDLFPPGELIEAEPSLWNRSRHHLHFEDAPLDAALENAIAYATAGKTVLIVANTILAAQRLYQQLLDCNPDFPCFLLHARFTFGDRRQKEAQISHPAAGTILIATQIVEVSLDISYDVLLTELAPIDALVQRMGRVNRRGEQPTAPVHIYTVTDKGTQTIYGKTILERSLELLAALPDRPTDQHFAEATQQLYEHIIHRTASWQEHFHQGKKALRTVQETLGCYTIDLADEEMRKLFSTRQGMISVEVLPQQFQDIAEQWKATGEGWRLPELLVPIPAYWLGTPGNFAPVDSLRCIVTTLPYSSTMGLSHPQSTDAAEQFFI